MRCSVPHSDVLRADATEDMGILCYAYYTETVVTANITVIKNRNFFSLFVSKIFCGKEVCKSMEHVNIKIKFPQICELDWYVCFSTMCTIT